mgnify:CR=1 FL=1
MIPIFSSLKSLGLKELITEPVGDKERFTYFSQREVTKA